MTEEQQVIAIYTPTLNGDERLKDLDDWTVAGAEEQFNRDWDTYSRKYLTAPDEDTKLRWLAACNDMYQFVKHNMLWCMTHRSEFFRRWAELMQNQCV